MNEYKILTARDTKAAEDIMNQMARDGWKVVDVTFAWANLLITFVRKKFS